MYVGYFYISQGKERGYIWYMGMFMRSVAIMDGGVAAKANICTYWGKNGEKIERNIYICRY